MDLMENYGIPAEEGIPRVLVFNHNKELINNTTTAEWRTARERSRQDIFNFFKLWKINIPLITGEIYETTYRYNFIRILLLEV